MSRPVGGPGFCSAKYLQILSYFSAFFAHLILQVFLAYASGFNGLDGAGKARDGPGYF
jgi:hypothetical protein